MRQGGREQFEIAWLVAERRLQPRQRPIGFHEQNDLIRCAYRYATNQDHRIAADPS